MKNELGDFAAVAEWSSKQQMQADMTNGAVWMEICVFDFWFGDIYRLQAGVP